MGANLQALTGDRKTPYDLAVGKERENDGRRQSFEIHKYLSGLYNDSMSPEAALRKFFPSRLPYFPLSPAGVPAWYPGLTSVPVPATAAAAGAAVAASKHFVPSTAWPDDEDPDHPGQHDMAKTAAIFMGSRYKSDEKYRSQVQAALQFLSKSIQTEMLLAQAQETVLDELLESELDESVLDELLQLPLEQEVLHQMQDRLSAIQMLEMLQFLASEGDVKTLATGDGPPVKRAQIEAADTLQI